jgi:hypothetical protein
MRILKEKKDKLDQIEKTKKYAEEVQQKNTGLRQINKYLVPLNPRVYMPPRQNPTLQKASPLKRHPLKLSTADLNPDLASVDEEQETRYLN